MFSLKILAAVHVKELKTNVLNIEHLRYNKYKQFLNFYEVPYRIT